MTERAKLKAGREKIVKGLLTWGGGCKNYPLSISLTRASEMCNVWPALPHLPINGTLPFYNLV